MCISIQGRLFVSIDRPHQRYPPRRLMNTAPQSL